MATFESKWWEIDIVDGWRAQRDEHCVSICHPDGVGALQISAYRTKTGTVSQEELLNATRLDEGMRKHLGKQEWGQFSGFQLVYAESDLFWRKWWLRCGAVMLFLTYNCHLTAEEIEREDVNQMVGSLRLANEKRTSDEH